jgi:hypothetical protein
MVRSFTVCALSIVIGVGFGWALRASRLDTNESATPARAPVAQLVLSQQQPAASSGFDLAQLHAAIREELAAAGSQAAHAQSATTAAKERVPASPELVTQRREALQEIQGMISSGEWGNNERIEFQRRIAVLDPEQARQALQQVLVGLNNGTIHAQTNTPL